MHSAVVVGRKVGSRVCTGAGCIDGLKDGNDDDGLRPGRSVVGNLLGATKDGFKDGLETGRVVVGSRVGADSEGRAVDLLGWRVGARD